MKLFPSPRIATEKIPESKPYIVCGEHVKLYRFSSDDYNEAMAAFNGPHLETGEELVVPPSRTPHDLLRHAPGLRRDGRAQTAAVSPLRRAGTRR
jgi:hypothetical protein